MRSSLEATRDSVAGTQQVAVARRELAAVLLAALTAIGCEARHPEASAVQEAVAPALVPRPSLAGPVERAAATLRDGVLAVGLRSCPAGESLAPVIDSLERELGVSIRFARVDAQTADLPGPFATGVPWTFVVRGGAIVDGFAGALGGETGQRLTRNYLLHLLGRNGLLAGREYKQYARALTAEYLNRELRGLNMSPANLVGAMLAGRNLVGAQLQGSDLSGADLRGARLDHALLFNATLLGANVEGASFDGAWFHRTTCPDGRSSDDNGGTCDTKSTK